MVQKRWHAQAKQTRCDEGKRNAPTNNTSGPRITAPSQDDQRDETTAHQTEQECRPKFTPESGREPVQGRPRRAQRVNRHAHRLRAHTLV